MEWSDLTMEEKLRNHEDRIGNLEDDRDEMKGSVKDLKEENFSLKLEIAAMGATLKSMSNQNKIVIGLLTAMFLEALFG